MWATYGLSLRLHGRPFVSYGIFPVKALSRCDLDLRIVARVGFFCYLMGLEALACALISASLRFVCEADLCHQQPLFLSCNCRRSDRGQCEMRPPGRGAAWYGCYFEEDRAVLVCRYVVLC